MEVGLEGVEKQNRSRNLAGMISRLVIRMQPKFERDIFNSNFEKLLCRKNIEIQFYTFFSSFGYTNLTNDRFKFL